MLSCLLPLLAKRGGVLFAPEWILCGLLVGVGLPAIFAAAEEGGSDGPRTTIALAKENFLSGNYAAAATIYRDECERCLRKHGEADLRSAQLLNNLAVALHRCGVMAEAEKSITKAFEYRREKLGPTHPDTLTSQNNLALILQTVGDYTAAERNLRAVVDGRRKVLGDAHPSTAQALNNLGCLLATRGKYDESETVLKEAIAVREKRADAADPGLAATLNNIASVKFDRRDPEARKWIKRATEAAEKSYGGLHPAYAIVASNQALAETRTVEASKLFQRALQIQEQAGATGGPDHALLLNKVVDFHINAMDEHTVISLAGDAVKASLDVFGRRNPATALALNNQAIIEHLVGDTGKAAALLEEAAEINEAVLGKDHPAYAENLVNLARIHRDAGNVAAAEAMEAKAFEIFTSRSVGEDPRLISLELGIAAYAVEQGNLDEAQRLYADALERSTKGGERQDLHAAMATLGLGAVACRDRREREGEKLLDEAATALQGIRSSTDLPLAQALSMLGTCRCNLDRFDQAVPPLQASLAILEEVLRPEHPAIAASRERLAAVHEKLGNTAEATRLREANAPLAEPRQRSVVPPNDT